MKSSKILFILLNVIFCLGIFSYLFADENMIIKITTPKYQRTRFNACENITISVDITINDGTIDRVYYYANGKSLGSERQAPYDKIWENVSPGIYELTAMVRDRDKNQVTSDPVLIFVDPVDDNDLVLNGEFMCNKLPWVLNLYEGAKATYDIEQDGWLSGSFMGVVDIEDGISENWHIQLVQYVPLDSGHTYEISYMLESMEEFSMLISLHLDVDPYTRYWEDRFQLTEYGEYGPHIYECDITDPKARLTFQIGSNSGPLYLDAVKIIDLNWADTHFTGISDANPNQPVNYNLKQNFPNPFNPETAIEYTIPQADYVNITIYNIRGEKVKSLAHGKRAAGTHTIKWNGQDDRGNLVNSGCYIYRMSTGNYVESHKMLLLK